MERVWVKRSLAVLTVALVCLLTFVVVQYRGRSTAKSCTSEVFRQRIASESLYYTENVTTLKEIAQESETYADANTDTNCLYVATMAYLNGGELEQAERKLADLKTQYGAQNGYKEPIKSFAQTPEQLESLLTISKETKSKVIPESYVIPNKIEESQVTQ